MPSPLYETLLGLKALCHRVITFERACAATRNIHRKGSIMSRGLRKRKPCTHVLTTIMTMHPLLSMSLGNTYPVVGEEKKSGAASPSEVPDLMVHKMQHIPMLHCLVSPDLFLHCLTLFWKLQQQPLLEVERQTVDHIGSIRHLGSTYQCIIMPLPVHKINVGKT